MSFCSECGSENPDAFAFCGTCGKSSSSVSDALADAPAVTAASPKRRTGLIVGALVAVAAFVAVVAWSALAPVRQNSVRYVIPADAQAYVEVDLLALAGDEATVFIESLWDEAGKEVGLDQDSPAAALDKTFDEMAGVTFTDGVQPWIGRHIAAAAFDVDPRTLEENGGLDLLFADALDGAGSLLVVADVREPDLADEFLDDLADGLRRRISREGLNWTMGSTTIGGVRFFEAVGVPDVSGWRAKRLSIYFGRSDDIVLFATSEDLLEGVLDVQSGSMPALASSEGFIEALEESQAGAFLTAYADSGLAEDLLNLENSRNADFTGLDRTARAAKWVALSASIVQDELLVASQIGFDSDRLPDDASAWLESLNNDDLLAPSFDGYDSYFVWPAYGRMCPFFSVECEPDAQAIDNVALGFAGGEWDAAIVTFASTDDMDLFRGDGEANPPFQSSGGWQVRLLPWATEAVDPDGLVWWDFQREFDTSEEAVDFIENSEKLGDSDTYRSARSALASSATTIFYFDGNQYLRSGSDWIGPVIPETGIGGITWDGTTLRADAIIKIDRQRTRIDTEASPSGPSTDAITFGNPDVVGSPLPQMPTRSPSDSTSTGIGIPLVVGSDFSGSAVTIENDGRAKAIVFLTHWSSNSQALVSDLQQWLDDGGIDTNIDIYSVVTASGPDRSNFPPSTWLETEGWTLPVIVDDEDNSVHAAFGSGGFPFWVFVNTDGSVASRFAGRPTFEELGQMLENLS